jgi:hypothetical protein
MSKKFNDSYLPVIGLRVQSLTLVIKVKRLELHALSDMEYSGIVVLKN